MSGDVNNAPGGASVVANHAPGLLQPAVARLWAAGVGPVAQRCASSGAPLCAGHGHGGVAHRGEQLPFYGWGIGIAALDFTGVSGHTLLATAFLPLLLRGLPGGTRTLGACTGAGLALVVGVSRVMVGAHSVSEVLAAWLLGLAVSWPVVQRLRTARWRTGAPAGRPCCCWRSTPPPPPTCPRTPWRCAWRLWLSGQVQPFTRHAVAPAPCGAVTPTRP